MARPASHERAVLSKNVAFTTLLTVLGDSATGHGNRLNVGCASREYLASGRSPMTAKHWCHFQMVVPSPKHSWVATKLRKDPNPGVLPQLVHVVDFDGDKTGSPVTLAQILETVPEPLCVVPTRTPGHFQVWFALSQPTWLPMNQTFQGDPAYNRHTIAWNPIYRTLNTNDAGQGTWFHPDIAHGALPLHDPVRFITDGGEVAQPSFDPTSSETAPGSRLSLTELEDQMRAQTAPGQRRNLLHRYLCKRCATEHKKLGRHLERTEIQELAEQGNALFGLPLDSTNRNTLVEYHYERPFYAKQSARASKPRTVQHDVLSEIQKLGSLSSYARHYNISLQTASKRAKRASEQR